MRAWMPKRIYAGQPNNPLRGRADQLKLSCSKLAAVTGCPIPTIKGWLRGSHYPRPKDHEGLARGLQVKLDTLEGWLNRMHPGKGIGFRKILDTEAKKKLHLMRQKTPRTRSEIAKAVASYLQSGGEIKKLPDEAAYNLLKEYL